jgi:hypothetical protein
LAQFLREGRSQETSGTSLPMALGVFACNNLDRHEAPNEARILTAFLSIFRHAELQKSNEGLRRSINHVL